MPHSTHPAREMKPGDVVTIPCADVPSWLKETRIIERENAVRFEFDPFLDISVDVKCMTEQHTKRGAPIKHIEIHSLGVGHRHTAPIELAQNYRSVIAHIERTTDKRFLMQTSKSDLTVTRLPNLADKKDYRTPKNKYGLGEMPVWGYKKFDQTYNLMLVSKSVDEYTKRTNGLFCFKKEWRGGNLHVYRVP